jgi:hypothetical protein
VPRQCSPLPPAPSWLQLNIWDFSSGEAGNARFDSMRHLLSTLLDIHMELLAPYGEHCSPILLRGHQLAVCRLCMHAPASSVLLPPPPHPAPPTPPRPHACSAPCPPPPHCCPGELRDSERTITEEEAFYAMHGETKQTLKVGLGFRVCQLYICQVQGTAPRRSPVQHGAACPTPVLRLQEGLLVEARITYVGSSFAKCHIQPGNMEAVLPAREVDTNAGAMGGMVDLRQELSQGQVGPGRAGVCWDRAPWVSRPAPGRWGRATRGAGSG